MNQQEIRDAIYFIEAVRDSGEQIAIAFGLPGRPVKAYDLAIAALRLQIWHKIEDLDMDEPEKMLLCRFSDGTIETFPAASIPSFYEGETIITHFCYLPDPPEIVEQP